MVVCRGDLSSFFLLSSFLFFLLLLLSSSSSCVSPKPKNRAKFSSCYLIREKRKKKRVRLVGSQPPTVSQTQCRSRKVFTYRRGRERKEGRKGKRKQGKEWKAKEGKERNGKKRKKKATGKNLDYWHSVSTDSTMMGLVRFLERVFRYCTMGH